MIAKRALLWYYLYCVAGSVMIMPVYLILALSLNRGIGSTSAKIASFGAVIVALLVLPIWRFPNFTQNVLRPVSVTITIFSVLLGYAYLSDLVLGAALAIYPRGFTTMWLGPILFVIFLPFIVGLEVKTKHTFERIPNRIP